MAKRARLGGWHYCETNKVYKWSDKMLLEELDEWVPLPSGCTDVPLAPGYPLDVFERDGKKSGLHHSFCLLGMF